MADTDTQILTLTSLLRLRWVPLVALAFVAVADTAGLGMGWPVGLLWGLLGALTLGQLSLWFSIHRPMAEWVASGILLGDGLILTVLFAATDGSSTPYALLYVFPVVLAGLAVRPLASWAVLAATTAGYASLFWLAPADLHAHDPSAMRAHVWGMFAAYAATASLVVFAVGRLRHAKAQAEARVQVARAMEARNQRLASLATLAAGAAHELATPLSTIAVVAGELARRTQDPESSADIVLIREEVARCHRVLTGLSADAGAGTGSAPERLSTRALLDGSLTPSAALTLDADEAQVTVPVELVGQVLRRLVENALDAEAERVVVTASVADGRLFLVVEDDGHGMPTAQLEQAGEPFYTTKQGGMGLGLYFARKVVEQLSGTFAVESSPGEGTRITLSIPSAP